jgi:hypothetical protein
VNVRFVSLCLAAASLVYACGPRPPANEAQARRKGEAPKGLVASLDVTVNGRVRLDFEVLNGAERKVELNFPSGHTHDFVVEDSLGREVWKWSDGRLFTQSMQNKVLGRDESVEYGAEWNPGSRHGTFFAVVSLRSENHPLEQRIQFSVP